MNTRTGLILSNNGIVKCYHGSLWDFVDDIVEFIVPMLEDKITARFNTKEITIFANDNVESIRERLCKKFM